MALTVKPLILKSHLIRKHLELCKLTTTPSPRKHALPRRRLTHLLHPHPLPLPTHLHLPLHSPPIRHLNLTPSPSIPFLHRFRPSPLSSPMSSLTSSSSAPSDSSQIRTVRVVIKGRVQGVFYRNWTVENATELGLKGWVRNRRDGSVEALFSGSSSKVEEMEQRCRRGPRDAMVTGIEVLPCTDDPGSGFERRSTV
ncbi:hypothetical protein LguiB_035089 [Lonicera macranthoides]